MTEVESMSVLCLILGSIVGCVGLYFIIVILDRILKRLGVFKVIKLCRDCLKERERDDDGEYSIGLLDGRQEIARRIIEELKEK